jgi:hypothetical protein
VRTTLRRAFILLLAIAGGVPAHAHKTIPTVELSQQDLTAIRGWAKAIVPAGAIESIRGYGYEATASWVDIRFAPQEHIPEYEMFLTLQCRRPDDRWVCGSPERNLAIPRNESVWETKFAEGISPDDAYRVFDACWRLAGVHTAVIARSGEGFRWFGGELDLDVALEGTARLEAEPWCGQDR